MHGRLGVLGEKLGAEPALVAAVLSGDSDAADRFIQRFDDVVRQVVRSTLAAQRHQAQHADVDDLVSKVFVRGLTPHNRAAPHATVWPALGRSVMARKQRSVEQIIRLLREVEVGLATNLDVGAACKKAGINKQTYYRWRKTYGSLEIDQAKRLKELESQNARLMKIVGEKEIDIQILKEALRGN